MKYYISRRSIIFNYVVILIVLGLAVTLLVFESFIIGGVLLLGVIISFVRNLNQSRTKDPIVILEKEYFEIVTGKERFQFYYSEIRSVERYVPSFSFGASRSYIVIKFKLEKPERKISLPDLTISEDDLVQAIRERIWKY